jgi:FAD:protein FMN transferase
MRGVVNLIASARGLLTLVNDSAVNCHRTRWRYCAAVVATLLLGPSLSLRAGEDLALERYARSELHMGVEFEVVLYAADEQQAKAALDAAMARIAELDKRLSDYDLASELSRLSATSDVRHNDPARGAFAPVTLSDDLWQVLSASQSLSEKSGGAFDVTVGPLTKLWRRARRRRELPEPELLTAAKASVGYRFLQLDSRSKTATLLKPNMRLDLGGIAKGFAADEAVKVVQARGIGRVLVRASGDIAAGDAPPGEKGWLVGIAPLEPDQPPERFLYLANGAISTSGDARQHLVVAGHRYSHILDPRTREPIEGRSSVTVVAPRGMLSDALASAVSVLGPQDGLQLIEQYDGTELLMVHEDGSGMQQTVQTPGIAKYAAPPPEP